MPESASQTRAVVSAEAVTTRLPSGLNAAEQNLCGVPLEGARGLPDSASETCAVLSAEAVQSACRRAERGGVDQVSVSLEGGEGLAGVKTSQTRAVLSYEGGDDPLAVGAERGGDDRVGVSLERDEGLAGGDFPRPAPALSNEAVTTRLPSGLKVAE